MNSRAIDYLMKILKNNRMLVNYKFAVKPVSPQTFKYSTNIMRPMDVFDFFTDLLCDKPNNTIDTKRPENHCVIPLSKIDQIIADINVKNPHISSKMLANELSNGITNGNHGDVNKVITFCIDKEIHLPIPLLSTIAGKYSNSGLVEELMSVQKLCKLTNETEYYKKGEFLHHLALCYWIRGNCIKSLELLRECSIKYPSLNDTTKKVLKCVIPQAVKSRSRAQLINVISFVQQYTIQSTDFYPLTMLWNELFLSSWYDDQESAQKLLDCDTDLQRCVSLLVPSLIPFLISQQRISDVYRFLPILLKYKFTDSYSIALQILFDYYCNQNDKNNCAEIVKSSVELDAPLREEQYNQFISWTVYGSPYKSIKRNEVEKIYSTF